MAGESRVCLVGRRGGLAVLVLVLDFVGGWL